MLLLSATLALTYLQPLEMPMKQEMGSDLDAGRICGYGTARCRRNCKKHEFKVGKCPNTYPCCLKKWNGNSPNPSKDRKPKGAWLPEMAASQTSEPPFSGPSRWTVPSGTSLVE
ncbi:hypothetical protein FD754_015684 [Muntiacus muntjak]|uniref:Beta-defensin n=1 Tax=Muntiacus muntjak TaxID=9888 RepID=A0A5N3VNI2_MUNMU|nr:hypothetical protein FD754_015684 [Muntiacus muntjak]